MTTRVAALAASALLVALSCKQDGRVDGRSGSSGGEGEVSGSSSGSTTADPKAKDVTAEPSTPTGGAAGADAPATTATVVEKAPPPRLYDKPVERRLHSDRLEASSFLWTDWNKFQENYHPNYLMDGDPATAWVEGADSSGKGEWIRVHVSPVEGVTRVRLRLLDGYHKSKALFGKNARARRITVTALPGGQKHAADLADSMDWQEIAFEVPAGKVDAIELSVDEVYEGTKYTDLCLSELEVFLTGLTIENPAFEKAKRDDLIGWKKNRLAAASLFGSKKAAALPILPGYRVQDDPTFEKADGFPAHLEALAGKVPASAEIARRAAASLASEHAGWRPVQVVARPALALPAVDGLYEPGSVELVFEPRDDAFMLPTSQQGVLLSSRNLSLFDTRDQKDPRQRTDCKEGKTWYMRPPRAEGAAASPLPAELLVVRCVVEETREGQASYTVWQLLEFDAKGNLALMVGPQDIQWLEWREDATASGGSVLTGGVRLRSGDRPAQRLVDGRVVARD